MVQAVLEKFHNNTLQKDAGRIVEEIKNYIKQNDCPNLSMDVSHLNIIDASKIAVLCSTYHWAKYPNGEISWKIPSKEIKELINPLNLGNIRLVSAQ